MKLLEQLKNISKDLDQFHLTFIDLAWEVYGIQIDIIEPPLFDRYTYILLQLQETKHLISNSRLVICCIAELKEFQWLSTTGLS